MKTIILEILPQYYWDIISGAKKFELREIRNRHFEAGDILQLRCDQLGTNVHVKVTHITRGPAYCIPEGWCIMSIELETT